MCILWVFFFLLLVMLPSEIPKLPTGMPVREFPTMWKLLLLHDSPQEWVSIPKSFVSVFVFYIVSYLHLKRSGCLFACVVSSASIQKLFCESYSTFNCSFDEFMGEKVVSPSYSFAILGLPLGLGICRFFKGFLTGFDL